MGVSFAIPSDTVNDVFYQLKTKGKVSRGWLGVYIQEIDDKLAKSFGLKKARGALVSKILPNSPAEKARFKQGDVILKFNDNEINKSTDLPLIVGQSKVGKSFRVQIIRNKLITNLSVTLEELPTEEKIATIGTKKITSNSFSGISVKNLSPQDIKLLDIEPPVLTIKLDPIEELISEEKIELNPIYFDFDKFNITNQAAFELDKLVAIMKKYPDMVIRAESHTDNRGPASYNMLLSEKRAKSTAQYIISRGINEGRITGVGKGEEDPKVNCSSRCSKDDHAKNRRSEFLIISR